MTPSTEAPSTRYMDLGLTDVLLAGMNEPVWLLIIVIIGAAIAVLARGHVLGMFLGYCLAAAGVIPLITSAFILPDGISRAGWIAAALIIYAGAAIAPRLISRYETI